MKKTTLALALLSALLQNPVAFAATPKYSLQFPTLTVAFPENRSYSEQVRFTPRTTCGFYMTVSYPLETDLQFGSDILYTVKVDTKQMSPDKSAARFTVTRSSERSIVAGMVCITEMEGVPTPQPVIDQVVGDLNSSGFVISPN